MKRPAAVTVDVFMPQSLVSFIYWFFSMLSLVKNWMCLLVSGSLLYFFFFTLLVDRDPVSVYLASFSLRFVWSQRIGSHTS